MNVVWDYVASGIGYSNFISNLSEMTNFSASFWIFVCNDINCFNGQSECYVYFKIKSSSDTAFVSIISKEFI